MAQVGVGWEREPRARAKLVPVPVECRETVPARPVMPADALAPGVSHRALLRVALAEIDRREGYEVQMRTASVACTAPAHEPTTRMGDAAKITCGLATLGYHLSKQQKLDDQRKNRPEKAPRPGAFFMAR